MSGMRAEQEFELQPNGMIVSNAGAPIKIVLKPHFRELAGIIGYVRGNPPAAGAIGVAPVEFFVLGQLTGNIIAAYGCHPAFANAIGNLSIETVIEQGFT